MEEYNNYFCLVNDFFRILFFFFYVNLFCRKFRNFDNWCRGGYMWGNCLF